MTFLETYGKELFSLLVPLLAWTLNRYFRGRARLEVAQPHNFTYLVQQPLVDAQGNQVQPTQTAHTTSLIVRNSGRDTATHLELVFNWKPMCLNVWPPRHFEEHNERDSRYVLVFDSLSPGEVMGCEILSVNIPLPTLLTARSDQCVAQFVNMYPQPVISRARRSIGLFLTALGLAAAVYGAILLVQFLVLRTPLGY